VTEAVLPKIAATPILTKIPVLKNVKLELPQVSQATKIKALEWFVFVLCLACSGVGVVISLILFASLANLA
jgi:hypothetical protein